jgi:CRP-like cAMP-binding protein
MGVGELFGEMSFLQGGVASASIVAAQDSTMVYCIDKNFVDSLLDINANAELPGRFYKFLAHSLAGRLRN